MKKATTVRVCAVCAAVLSAVQPVWAKKAEKNVETPPETEAAVSTVPETSGEELDPKTGFPVIKNKPFIMFNEGFAFSQVTRLIKQDERSNFVWQDYLVGLYTGFQTVNMRPLNSMVRLSVFYPFYHTFDGMKQDSKQTILYAFDLFAGPMIQTDMWKYVRLNFALGPHYMYELSDEYHHHDLGGGLMAGMELPVARRWTILMNGYFTLDYGNIGTNRTIEPYDFEWSYQLEFGVRYSRKGENKYAYIHKRAKK